MPDLSRTLTYTSRFRAPDCRVAPVWPTGTEQRKFAIEPEVVQHPIASAGEFFGVEFDFGGVEAGDDERLDDLVFSELGDQPGHPACVVDCHLTKRFGVFDGLVVDDAKAH